MGRALLTAISFALLLSPTSAHAAQSTPTADCLSAGLPAGAQSEWSKTLAAARQEGKLQLSLPRGLEEFRRALSAGFEADCAVPTEHVGLGAPQMLQRLKEERAAGKYLWDVFVGGTNTLMFNLKSLGVLEPIEPALILPEVKDVANWSGGKLPFFDRDQLGLFVLYGAGQYFYLNTSQAEAEEIGSYRDLLQPKWKGNILVTRDPRLPGHGRSIFLFFYVQRDLGPDFVRALTQQNLQIPKDEEQAERWLAQGKYAICFCNNAEAVKLIGEGYPVKLLDPHGVKEGSDVTSSFANVALINRAPHPNGAKVYINWLLSPKVGLTLSKLTRLASPRADVSREFVKPSAVPEPGWPILNHEEMQTKAKEMVKFIEGFLPAKPAGSGSPGAAADRQ